MLLYRLWLCVTLGCNCHTVTQKTPPIQWAECDNYNRPGGPPRQMLSEGGSGMGKEAQWPLPREGGLHTRLNYSICMGHEHL